MVEGLYLYPFFLCVDVQLFQYHLLSRLLLHRTTTAALSEIKQHLCDNIYVGLYLGSLFCSIDPFVYFFIYYLITIALYTQMH